MEAPALVLFLGDEKRSVNLISVGGLCQVSSVWMNNITVYCTFQVDNGSEWLTDTRMTEKQC